MLLQEVLIQTREGLQSAPWELVQADPPLTDFQLTPDICITILPNKIAEQVLSCFDPRWFGFPKQPVRATQLYSFVRTHYAPDGPEWHPDETLEACVGLSRLVHPTSFPLRYHAKIRLSSHGELEEAIPIETKLPGAWIAEGGRDWLTHADARSLQRLVAELPLIIPKRALRAYWLHEFAARNFFADIRWTLIATGLEALIHTDKNGSTKQFTTRVAKLAAAVGVPAFDESQAGRFYDMRSQIAHGQGIGQLASDDVELYKHGEDVLRLTLRRSVLEKDVASTFTDKAAIIQNWAP